MTRVEPVGVIGAGKSLVSFARGARPVSAAERHPVSGRGWFGSFAVACALLLAPAVSRGGILSESDFRKVENIKPLFQGLMGDLVQTSKRSDISSGDVDCIMSTIRELLQISEELSSYEYLITIEKEITDVGDNSPVKGVVKFAIEKSNTILAEERRRLLQLSDRCSRFPLAYGKTQQALQFIDMTSNLLSSIRL